MTGFGDTDKTFDDIEEVEPEAVDEQEYLSRSQSKPHDDEVKTKTALVQLHHQEEDLKLQRDIKRREAEFALFAKKACVTAVFVVAILGVVSAFISFLPDRVSDNGKSHTQAFLDAPVSVRPAGAPASNPRDPREAYSDRSTLRVGASDVDYPRMLSEQDQLSSESAINTLGRELDGQGQFSREVTSDQMRGKSVGQVAHEGLDFGVGIEPVGAPAPVKTYMQDGSKRDVDGMLRDMLQAEMKAEFIEYSAPTIDRSSPKRTSASSVDGSQNSRESLEEVPAERVSQALSQSIPKRDVSEVVESNAYEVQWGDTFFAIAIDQNISVERLAHLNGLRPPFSLRVGQILRLDGPAKDVSVDLPDTLSEEPVTQPSRLSSQYKIFVKTASSVWVIDADGRNAIEARVGSDLGTCGQVLSVGENFDHIRTTGCADIRS
ncbi:LysM peptidoglycan-binding domain-containing protein [Porticoccaceae bacterium]|nr:LysM peptidoglycan-binding domain-containing protein [Porticoccaceae bacterium]MDA8682054.1 LysM peptidoglycan-binding domain-containing protein [Porticoccaceae bacterium]MDB2343071.1 LysM peptidoglycan-binding domain-containing protein [Porticoccaceae bacterium]MDB2664413.1 LysM peptidoglycan-binding domain-containing protein [Porticoccaceae bacterium]